MAIFVKCNGEFYRGIYATAYVSKGAPDTWEKVLDGTLSGFSIGGSITDQETKFVRDAGENGKTIRFIKAYDLIELSLVDNPANQLANLDSIVKVFSIKEDTHGDKVMKGMAVDTHLVNVFWCANDEIAKNSTAESETCLSCGSSMEQIGWFEKGEDEAHKTAAAVADFLRQKEENNAVTKQADTTANGEGGVEMADENKSETEEATETDVVTSDDAVDAEEVNAEEVAEGAQVPEDSAEVSEEQVAEREKQEEEALSESPSDPDFEKMFDDLKVSVKDSVEKTVQAVESKVEEATKAFDDKASEFEKGLNELRDELKAVKDTREDVSKRLDALEKSSAVKKSGEVEGTEPVKKSKQGLWGGAFFDNE